jgi:heme exporter protein A
VAETLTETEIGGPSSAVTEHALEVEGLVRRYGEREALAGVGAQLALGETLAVFGPNGAGKTTFLRVLATLLLPQGGSVRVLGRELPRETAALRREIGFLGHEPLLYRELSGRENLVFYARLYSVAEPEARIAQLLDAVGMSVRADDRVGDLSRGMVQRIAVCRAVLHRPRLLLLDEPRANLDPEAAELVEPLIGRGCGCTRVLVTHDVERGLRESDRVLALREGRVLLDAPAAGADPARVRAVYQGVGEGLR